MQQESAHYIHDVIVNNSWSFFFFFLFFFKVFWELLEDLAHVLIHAWDCFMKNRLWDLNLSCFYFLKGIEQGFINLWEKQGRAIFRSRSIQGSQLSMLFNFVQSQSRIIISKYLRNDIYLKNSKSSLNIDDWERDDVWLEWSNSSFPRAKSWKKIIYTTMSFIPLTCDIILEILVPR